MTRSEKNIFLGFDFYGAGNIGDDIMMSGFLLGLPEQDSFKMSCITAHNLSSQVKRFPRINWLQSPPHTINELIANTDAWIGVGDTPFQLSGGPWFIDKLAYAAKICKAHQVPSFMVGVGAEEEALDVKNGISTIIESFQYIWTRDQYTADFLIQNCSVNSKKINVGGDLANICFKNIFNKPDTSFYPKYDLAVNFYIESVEPGIIDTMRRFLKRRAKEGTVVFFANETRMALDHAFYQALFGGWRHLLKPGHIHVYVPDYMCASMVALIRHFSEYRVVMASRYHALLAAAWAGSKVVALGRTSKISALARELDIPLVSRPFNLENLQHGFDNAVHVSYTKLIKMAERAEQSIRELCEQLN